MEEVLARIESSLRRIQFQSAVPKRLQYKNLIFDGEKNTFFLNGQELLLTAKELAILELLMRYPDKIFSKANLFQSVWNTEYLNEDNTLNVHISNLRNKMKAFGPDEEYIDTVWGIGYRRIRLRNDSPALFFLYSFLYPLKKFFIFSFYTIKYRRGEN